MSLIQLKNKHFPMILAGFSPLIRTGFVTGSGMVRVFGQVSS